MPPRRHPPRTVKGKDIELLASDGQRVPGSLGAMLFTNPPPKPKARRFEVFGKAIKALKD